MKSEPHAPRFNNSSLQAFTEVVSASILIQAHKVGDGEFEGSPETWGGHYQPQTAQWLRCS
ncbi:MAG: hypothetical protein FRX49_04926 [Trebouxia sp. A1-2]|nr:MAG: hypothetical protein FRX49_04926 [Trebouxia sp. A1-2]